MAGPSLRDLLHAVLSELRRFGAMGGGGGGGAPFLELVRRVVQLQQARARAGGAPGPEPQVGIQVVGPGGAAGGGAQIVVGLPALLRQLFEGDGASFEDIIRDLLTGQPGAEAGPQPMPPERLAALEQVPVTSEMDCAICQDKFSEGQMGTRLQCGHIFHGDCVRQWLELHATCPVCREDLLRPSQPS